MQVSTDYGSVILTDSSSEYSVLQENFELFDGKILTRGEKSRMLRLLEITIEELVKSRSLKNYMSSRVKECKVLGKMINLNLSIKSEQQIYFLNEVYKKIKLSLSMNTDTTIYFTPNLTPPLEEVFNLIKSSKKLDKNHIDMKIGKNSEEIVSKLILYGLITVKENIVSLTQKGIRAPY